MTLKLALFAQINKQAKKQTNKTKNGDSGRNKNVVPVFCPIAQIKERRLI